MSLPDVFERTRQALNLSVPPLELEGIETESLLPGSGPVLGFDMEPQDENQNFWCWAAVGVSVRRFLRGDVLMQCELATAVFNGTVDCCQNPDACDAMKPLEIALFRAGVYQNKVLSPIPPVALSNEISGQRPLGCAVRWLVDGTAHFVVIYGFSQDFDGTPWVAVDDPKYGKWEGTYASFRNAYLSGAGRWVASYFTT